MPMGMLPWTNIIVKLTSKKKFVLITVAGIILFIFHQNQKTPIVYPSLAYVFAQRGNDLPLYTTISADEDMVDVFGTPSAIEKVKFQSLDKPVNEVKGLNSNLSGVLNVHIWDEICTERLDLLRHYPLFPNMPSRRMFTDAIKVKNIESDCGIRVFGYIKPINTGNYKFALSASHGEAELWLSTNKEPDNSKLICSAFSFVSKPEMLKEGHFYYIEVLLKVGVRASNLEVKWSLSDDTFNVIDHSRLKPYFDDSGIIANEVLLSYNVLPNLDIHRKLAFPLHHNTPEIGKRIQMLHLPFVDEKDIEDLLPICQYSPSYIPKSDFTSLYYQGVWETHYTAVYPVDATNLTLKITENYEQKQFGNDVLDGNRAQKIVDQVVAAIKRKHLGKYKYLSTLNVEENPDSVEGSRFLVELELFEPVKGKVRFSEYVYLPKGKTDICYPKDFKWNKNAVVNLILTVGNQGRWAKHYVDTMSHIYEATKDKNMNVIIVDFNSQDIDLAKALEESPLPRYTLLNKFNRFYKTEAIQQAANSVRDKNSIVLQLDLHLTMPLDFIDNVRKHCVQGKMAYSPLLARLSCDSFPERPLGFWEVNGYGIFGIYKSDWDTFGGMNVKQFRNSWGGEDWDLLDRCMQAGYEVERLKLLHFNHIHHSKKGMWHRFKS